jgi:hypothetical protein
VVCDRVKQVLVAKIAIFIESITKIRMKTPIERSDTYLRDSSTMSQNNIQRRTHLPFAILFAMGCAVLLMDAILPLRDLWFHEALLTQLGWWPVLLSLIFFPGWALIPPVPQIHVTGLPQVIQSWEKIPLLLGAFVVVFLVYLLALQRLPKVISRRYIVNSTLLLGFLYILIPIVTSSDVFSYIAYARIGVIHHLNPLTTLPTAIRTDPIFKYLSWTDQPSAYGPTWTFITSAWQWMFSVFGLDYLLVMVIALRIQGLAMHVVSTLLIWSISGHLQQVNGNISLTKRLLATLAFAWNPLLLFEACINAHADTTLLTLILLSIWFLTRYAARSHTPSNISPGRERIDRRFASFADSHFGSLILAAAILAFATCLKINVILLAPGLIFYGWTRKSVRGGLKHAVAAAVTYIGIILLLYAPFWQGGASLNVFSTNPATYRSINSPAAFAGHIYNAIANASGYPLGASIGSPAERITHTISMGIFVVTYLLLCWRSIRRPGNISTLQGLIRWMAIVWLIYCALGSPWFWPWYLVTFFGLFALIEASPRAYGVVFNRIPWSFEVEIFFVRLLTFSLLSMYCFTTWGLTNSFVPGLPGFQWSYLSGLWVWILPLIGAAVLANVRGPKDKRGHSAPQKGHATTLHEGANQAS